MDGDSGCHSDFAACGIDRPQCAAPKGWKGSPMFRLHLLLALVAFVVVAPVRAEDIGEIRCVQFLRQTAASPPSLPIVPSNYGTRSADAKSAN